LAIIASRLADVVQTQPAHQGVMVAEAVSSAGSLPRVAGDVRGKQHVVPRRPCDVAVNTAWKRVLHPSMPDPQRSFTRALWPVTLQIRGWQVM
jgi:hypothetical protein